MYSGISRRQTESEINENCANDVGIWLTDICELGEKYGWNPNVSRSYFCVYEWNI